MEFKHLLMKRRSVRDYEDKEVPLATIQEIIRDCTLAPSASNEQPWRYVIVRDKTLIKKISDESKKNLLEDIRSTPGHPSTRYEGVLKQEAFNVFYNAPALVIIVGPKGHRSLREDLGLAASYFMLGAADRGLGTCWVNLGSFIQDPGLRAELGLTDDLVVVAPVIIGWPKLIPTPVERNQDVILKVIGG